MIYIYKESTIDLSKVTRIYPAALISAGGESASVSLEWADLKKDQITLQSYVLICDFDAVGETPIHRIELRFETKEELFASMNEIGTILKS